MMPGDCKAAGGKAEEISMSTNLGPTFPSSRRRSSFNSGGRPGRDRVEPFGKRISEAGVAGWTPSLCNDDDDDDDGGGR